MIYAERVLNKDTNMSAWFEENQELMLMTCPSPPKVKQRWKLYFGCLPMFTGRPVGIVGDWRWCEDYVCKFESHCVNVFFNACVVFAQIGLPIKIVHLLYYLTHSVPKLPYGTHTKSNWKWLPKCADCDVWKRMSNCYLSAKHTQPSNYSGTSISLTSRETKKYSSYRNTFFLLVFQLNLHQAYVL
jgi:hypothetical protein